MNINHLALGTPIRLVSPFTGETVIGEVMMWAGFKVIQEELPAYERVLPSGTRMSVSAETRYIHLANILGEIELVPANEYFLYRLRNG